MSITEWAKSDGLFGERTLANYKKALESGEAYHSKLVTGEEAKGFFFNSDDMEQVRQKEAEFRLPNSEGGIDLSEREKSILNSMFEAMYMKYNPKADDAQIKRFLQIIAENTGAQNEQPLVINLTAN